MTEEEFYKLDEEEMFETLWLLRLKHHYVFIDKPKMRKLANYLKTTGKTPNLEPYLVAINERCKQKQDEENKEIKIKLEERAKRLAAEQELTTRLLNSISKEN